MKHLLINLSNHAFETWPSIQKGATKLRFDDVIDMPHPEIHPGMTQSEIIELAQDVIIEMIQKKESYQKLHPGEVIWTEFLVTGEWGFTYSVVSKLKALGQIAIHPTAERKVFIEDNKKTSIFNFIDYREY